MLLKKILFICYVLFISQLFAETSSSASDKQFIDKAYTGNVDTFFSEGILEYNDLRVPFQIYQEKNKYNFYNLSLNIDNVAYKIVSNDSTDLYYIGKKKVTGETFLSKLPVPLNILSNALRDRNYIFTEKSSRFKFRNIKSNKLSITDKLPTAPTVSDYSSQIPILSDNVKTTVKANVYGKIDYIISANTPIILKKEFYQDNKNRKLLYEYETLTINYINGHYIPTQWSLKDSATDETIIFRYNTQSVIYNKKDISKEFSSMISFYGVK